MLYRHDVAGCLLDRVGAVGLGAGELSAVLHRLRPSLDKLRRLHREGSERLLALPALRDDLRALRPIATQFRRFADVVVLGTGGSSLGGQTLCALAARGASPRMHFMDNIDPATFEELLGALDLAHTGVIAISKSGGTAETLMQFLILLQRLNDRCGRDALARHCVVVTEPTANPMRRLAEREAIHCIDHDPEIGGRFSVLTNTGMLPALIAGLDAVAARRGAEVVLRETLAAENPRDSAVAVGAAVVMGLAEHRGLKISVLMPYVDRLASFGLWYRQLWAESLGKEGKGTTPVRALGTVDQHSQLQLYLDGPADKVLTLLMLDQTGRGERVGSELTASDPDLAYLSGRTMGDLLEAEQVATAESLMQRGRPTRVIRLRALNEESLGALFMHFLLETLMAADLLGISPFGQPAVEHGKVLARRHLGAMGKERAQSPA
ncbi:MAG TPA: glucose-6-phosphate isomerase [Stellaceae bacterium]|nr:glucose-6-phosphate isomerase [Stellaceae bacterium]